MPEEPAATPKAPKRDSITAVLDTFDEGGGSDPEVADTLPGHTRAHVLKWEGIPALGDNLGKTVPIGGEYRQVLK